MAGATNIPDLTPEEHKSLDQWASDLKDLDPNKAFDALGYSPGFGGYRTHEELTPGFWDNALARAGILTDKMRERQELSQKQQALLPFVKELMDEKIRLRHIMALTPGTDQDVPAEVARTLNINQPQPFAQGGTAPMAAPTGLQPAPNLQPSFGAEQPPMMLRPAPSAGDQAMAAMPLGTPGQIGALSNTAPFAAPPMQGEPPLPFSPLETTGYQNVPEYDPMTGGYRPGLQTVALREGPPMVTETVRDQPMVMADKKVVPPPLPAPAPRELPLWRRKQVADMMTAQAAGHIMPDESGKLVPSSFMAPDTRSLNDEQMASLASIYQGGAPMPGVRLPAGPYVSALKGKQEGKAQDVSLPVREYMKANNMPETPQSIEIARQAVRQEKLADEQKSIVTRELMQTTPQDVRAQLLKQGTNVLEATPDQIDKAIRDAADQELSVAARKKMQDFELSGLDGEEKSKLLGLQQVARVTHRLRTEFTPAERREFVGYFQLPLNRIAQIAKANPRFARFDALVNREGIAAFDTAGKALTATEASIIFGFLPQGKEWSPENFESKLMEGDDYARTKIGDIVSIATTTRRDMGKEMQKRLPKKEPKLSPAERYNQLEKQGMKEADIYNQLVVEGYK
jgi:hypothetical protein